jgi:hypothetical protein
MKAGAFRLHTKKRIINNNYQNTIETKSFNLSIFSISFLCSLKLYGLISLIRLVTVVSASSSDISDDNTAIALIQLKINKNKKLPMLNALHLEMLNQKYAIVRLENDCVYH